MKWNRPIRYGLITFSLITILYIFTISVYALHSEIPIFFDGFEDTAEWTNWVEVSGTSWANDGSCGASMTCGEGSQCACSNNADATDILQFKEGIDLSNNISCILTFYTMTDSGIDNNEYCQVDVTDSGDSWVNVYSCTNGEACEDDTWHLQNYNITNGVGLNSNFSIRAVNIEADNNEQCGFDSFNVTCETEDSQVTTLVVTLDEPADTSSFVDRFTDLIFNGTCNVTDGTIHNLTLWTNFSGTWQANQTNQSVITNDVKYSMNTALNHSTVGEYIWNMECCTTSSICNSSISNYSLSIQEPIINFDVKLLNTTPFTVNDGDDFVFSVNTSCIGTANCDMITLILDPVFQWEECINNTYYRWITIENITIKHPNGSIDYNLTWGKEYYNQTDCYPIEKYNLTFDKYIKEIDARGFGKCSYNDTCVTCDTTDDGNADGICQSGESCITYCYSGTEYIQTAKLDSLYLKTELPQKIKPNSIDTTKLQI